MSGKMEESLLESKEFLWAPVVLEVITPGDKGADAEEDGGGEKKRMMLEKS